jgi:NMD protein affecting ribosome stability and mRNA decay
MRLTTDDVRMLRRSRLAKGLCAECGEAKAARGRTCCWSCVARHKAFTVAREARRAADGLCADCSKPLDRPGKKVCSACLAKRSARSLKYLAAKADRLRGACLKCGAPATRGDKLCAACAAKAHAEYISKYRRNRAAAKCVRCGAAARPGKSQCAEMLRQWRIKKRMGAANG